MTRRHLVGALPLPPAGLRLKDGPASARAIHCQCWAEVGFILSPSARTGPSRLGPAGEGRSDGGVLHLHLRGQARVSASVRISVF